MEQSKSINVRYSMLQGIYFVGFCTVMGYTAVYLGSIGMSSSLIGIVLAIANILTSIAQPVLGGFVDKSNISMKKVLMVMFGLCSILSVLLMFVSKVTFLAAALFIAVSTILYTTMPLVNSLAFAFQKQGIDVKFGVARGIGSVAYALASLVLGNVVKAVSPTLMPLAYIVIFLGILPLIRSFKMPEAEVDEVIEEKVVEKESTGAFIKKHLKFMIFLAGFVLVYFDHTIINNFFINVIKNVGGNTGDMGNAVFLAAMLELPTMALFENYERRIDKINGVLAQYGISSVEECREICKAKGFDPYEIVKGIQPICFENACWAYTVGAAIAMKKGVKTAAEAATAIGEGLQAFCIDGSVADDRKVGLGHGNLGAMLLSEESKCFAFLAGHESFAAAEGDQRPTVGGAFLSAQLLHGAGVTGQFAVLSGTDGRQPQQRVPPVYHQTRAPDQRPQGITVAVMGGLVGQHMAQRRFIRRYLRRHIDAAAKKAGRVDGGGDVDRQIAACVQRSAGAPQPHIAPPVHRQEPSQRHRAAADPHRDNDLGP